MGQTRVDLQHLLEDLRDAYPGALEETILTEIVANSLDSGATRISLLVDPAEALLVAVDNGSGMSRREITRYHDVAASSKQRGEGIGFAGVGIKLGLLLCQEVLTETRREGRHLATRWRLASRHRAPWRWVDPPGFITAEHGTAVALKLRSPLSPLLDPSFLEAALGRHFQPLLEHAFDEVLAPHYPAGVAFVVDGTLAQVTPRPDEAVPIAIRLPRKRKPVGVGYLLRERSPLAEDVRGIAVSTRGKVIRRGWDWLGLMPAAPEYVGGLIEAPGLAESLTLNKADFIRSGARGLTYLAYRKAIQEAVSAQLAAWGEAREVEDAARRRVARPVERDLESVLVELADEFPTLAALVERRPGGQRRLPSPDALRATASPTVAPTTSAETGPPAARAAEAAAAGPMGTPAGTATLDVVGPPRGPRRPARYGLGIQFQDRPDDGISRLVETTVWVNTAHPAYVRAAASRSEGYHLAMAVAMALAPLAAEPSGAHAFVTTFLARWGEALTRDGRRRRHVDRASRLRKTR